MYCLESYMSVKASWKKSPKNDKWLTKNHIHVTKKLYEDNGYLWGQWENFKGDVHVLKVDGRYMDICYIVFLDTLSIFYKCSFITIQYLLKNIFNFKSHLNFKKGQ